jgi:lysophospholipase L1-like esterase
MMAGFRENAERVVAETMLVRLGLVAGGLVAGLAVLEIGLRLLALVAPQALSRSRPAESGPGPYIVCVGDSHTYGSMVAPEQAYPEQLERILRREGIPATVYNLGLPGQSTRQVLDRLPKQLAVYRPNLVLVWAGLNNFWNLKGRQNDPDGPQFRFSLNDLRVYRFFNLFRAAQQTEATFDQRRLDNWVVEGEFPKVTRWHITGPGVDETLEMPIVRGNLDPGTVESVTRDDLTRIVGLGREHDTPVVLFDYPFAVTDVAQAVNAAIRDVAADTATPLVDTGPIAAELRRRRVTDLSFKDMHPKPALYRAIAWDAARVLLRDRLVPEGARPATP